MIPMVRTIAQTPNNIRVAPTITNGVRATDGSCSAGPFDLFGRLRLANEIGIVIVSSQWRQELRSL
jgi:hypothetical protein